MRSSKHIGYGVFRRPENIGLGWKCVIRRMKTAQSVREACEYFEFGDEKLCDYDGSRDGSPIKPFTLGGVSELCAMPIVGYCIRKDDSYWTLLVPEEDIVETKGEALKQLDSCRLTHSVHFVYDDRSSALA